jgi:hypothetical protein
MSSTKRQQTMAKRNRERAVEEKRTLKRLKKQAAKAEKAAGGPFGGEPFDGEPVAGDASDAEPDVE